MVGVAHPLQRLTKQDGAQDGRQQLYVSISQEIYVIEQLFDVYDMVFGYEESDKHIFSIAWRSRDLGGQLTKLVK